MDSTSPEEDRTIHLPFALPMPPKHLPDLDALLYASNQLEAMSPLTDYPELEALRRTFLDQSRATVSRLVPKKIAALERQHGWAASFNRQMELCTDRLLSGPDAKGAVISRAEMRKKAPSFGHVLDALKERPELLAKVEQGFVRMRPVPVGLSPASFREPISDALRFYTQQKKLRSTNRTALVLDTATPVWMWDEYEGADTDGRLVYGPMRFAEDHGGKTKQQMLAESPFPGWQVLLLEELRDIPRQGKGQTIAGRPQIEAGRSPRQYLELLQTTPYAHEQGLTPEVWQAHFLGHLTETDGEVLDDYTSGSACYLTGAYFPSSRIVPCAHWGPVFRRAHLGGRDPGYGHPDDGARAAVRVI